MPFPLAGARRHLQAFDFENLFIQDLGWDHYRQAFDVPVDGESYRMEGVAEKRGFAVLLHTAPAGQAVPAYPMRRRIERQTAKCVHEHLIIFRDTAGTVQVWQWVKKEPGKPLACREHTYTKGQSGDPLLQKLQELYIAFEEEEYIALPDVTRRARAGFDVERVTKRFYDRFKAEHADFLKFIKGIPDEGLHRWYASVMLNRLMFIYFIQKKGFLDGDAGYLKNKLIQMKGEGKNQYYSDFLCPLFFEGFAKKESDRSAKINRLLGKIPYLNGGLFLKHQIEELHGQTITVADTAFDQLFNFFEQYQWHLDERPLRQDNEINPDVLGYIFEKYINQKQMGAYYTKEDITEYIAKSTIVPRLFDMAKPKCKVAFEREGDGPDTTVWRHLQADPDRYIYEPVRRGVVREDGTMLPESDLPPHVQKGMHDPKARMFDKNYNLKEAHLEDAEGKPLTLPTETWREYVARRERCLSLRDKLGNGELREINDLITHNLDLRQFAQDVIENSEGPELLRAFWQAIESVTVLDPTVGSGAFLFAALNILEPLYEACLDRMEAFLAELERSGAKHRPEKYADFKKVLEAIARHPNRKYFIYKSIIINNLYGVDIMDEAVEICKLRLFLKLVAQVDAAERIEPLPDIDFNIRAGNTLVGFVSLDEVRQAVNKEKSGQGKMVFSNVLGVIEEKAREVDRLFKAFRAQQTELGGEVTPEDKKSLQARLSELEGELNRYLAGEYGISVGAHGRAPSKRMPETRVAEPNGRIAMRPYEGWLASHKPFHWFIEFYGILQKGGFDVVIGNPPYVEYSKVFNDYTLRNYETLECGNLYACVIERNSHIQKHCGQTGMIIPHSAICTDRMANLQDILLGQDNKIWLSTFCIRPSKLFDGVDQRLSIFIVACGRNERTVYSSCYHRWHGNYRPFLFSSISFADVTDFEYSNSVPKVERLLEIDILHKISKMKKMAENISVRTGAKVYFHNAPRYWIRAMDFAPYFWNERDGQQLSTQVKIILVPIKEASLTMVTILNSSLFYWWFIVFSDCRHLNMREIERLPIDLQSVGQQKRQDLNALRNKLMEDYKRNKNRKTCEYKATGKVKYDEYYPKHSKPIIDEIDKIFATHYGLNAIELDFVINYDIKYRMGQGAGAEEE